MAKIRTLYLQKRLSINGRNALGGRVLYDRFCQLSEETLLGHVVYHDEVAAAVKDPRLVPDVVSHSLLRDFQPNVVFVEGGLLANDAGMWKIPEDIATEICESGCVLIVADVDHNELHQYKDHYWQAGSFFRALGSYGPGDDGEPIYGSDESRFWKGHRQILCDPAKMVISEWLRPIYEGVPEILVGLPIRLASWESLVASCNRDTTGTLHRDNWVGHSGACPFAAAAKIGVGFAVLIAGLVSGDAWLEGCPHNPIWLTNLAAFLVEVMSADNTNRPTRRRSQVVPSGRARGSFSMTSREAYSALIMGRLSRDYGSAWEKIRHSILWDNYTSPMEKYSLSRMDAERLRAAAKVKERVEPSFTDGIRTYESIFELLLIEEGILLWGGWQHMENSFRGHLDARWILSPTLTRVPPADAERHIEHSLRMARLLLDEKSPIMHLSAIKILGVLQHYSFMTPLLDFSTDIRIAAAFACRGFKSSSTGDMGCIIKAHNVDFQKLAPIAGTPLGQRVSFTVDEVARIRNQKGIFFADFKVGFLETLTSVERCYFKHGRDTELFGVTVGLTEDALFPPNDLVFRYIETCRDSLRAPTLNTLRAPQEAVLEEVEQLLRKGYRTISSTPEAGDYFSLAKNWTDWDHLSDRKRQEIRIFARWFGRLKEDKKLDLPPTCLTLTRLQHAVESIVAFDDRAEDSTDIFDRLSMHGKEAMIPVLKQIFSEVRIELSGAKPS